MNIIRQQTHIRQAKMDIVDRARFPRINGPNAMQLWISWCENQLEITDCLYDITRAEKEIITLHRLKLGFKQTLLP